MKYTCLICGYCYDEAKGIPQKGIKPGTEWYSLPHTFRCPQCGTPKNQFRNLARDFSGE